VRADKRETTGSSRRDRLSIKIADALSTNNTPDDAPVSEQSNVQPPWSAEQYPALDLMANWTNDRPSMSQILDGRSSEEIIDANRQSGDEVNMEV
jgi:hypothetical protein